jgi:hypothetical protein
MTASVWRRPVGAGRLTIGGSVQRLHPIPSVVLDQQDALALAQRGDDPVRRSEHGASFLGL